jgi:hypothetical protein
MSRFLHGGDEPNPEREQAKEERLRRLRLALATSRQQRRKATILSYKLTGGRLNDPPRRRRS